MKKETKISSSCLCLSLYWIIIATFMFCYLEFSIAGNNETDMLALLEIKAKIVDDPLRVMSSWKDTSEFCKWYGVTCGHRHQRVTILDLHSSKLTGIISPSIGNLSFLEQLYLYNNSFGGIIPPEIGRLRRLNTLELYNNSIGGEIPSNISSCNSLICLVISRNNFVGQIPPTLGYLSHLQILSLENNNLTGYLPSSLGNLSYLSGFSVTYNNLVGNIPDTICKIKSLALLLLANNKFSGVVPPSIFNLYSLIELDLGKNDLEGNLPLDLGNMLPRLEALSISSNHFIGQIPASISNSSELRFLQLSGNRLHGLVPSLQGLTSLTHLVVYDNFLGYGQDGDLKFVSSLSNSTSLETFQIGQNNFKGVLPRRICNFSSVTNLGLDNNMITGEIPMCIDNMAKLELLHAQNNALSGVIPHVIGKLQNLYLLRLDSNKLTGVIPPSIGNLSKLSKLGLFNNKLEGQIPSTLENCQSLILLDLYNNSLSGLIPSNLFSLTSLSIRLSLSRNHLTGSLPEEVGQLKNLNWLDISHNMLSDHIPSSLGSCMMLEVLNMAENKFSGTIPNTLQELKDLTKLNLSNNNFSGEIPRFLASFPLQSLDLSYNHFEGEIPIGGVFSNVTSVFISGNSKLCRGNPELKLPHCKFSHKTHGIKMERWMKLTISIVLGFFGVVLVALLVFFYIHWQKKKSKNTNTFEASEKFSNLSYQSILQATNGLSSENLIGSGRFGVVYKGSLQENGQTVAFKVFKLEYYGALKSFMVECGVLRTIRHRNLVKVITACSSIDYQGREFKALVYEYMVNGSLEDWLYPKNTSDSEAIDSMTGSQNPSKNLNLRQRLDIAISIAFALDYLHHHCGTSIVHCDLKPSNILLDDDMVAHVGDFGLAKLLLNGINNSVENQSSSIGVRGTIGYTPPEYGLGNKVSTYGDVYSFGILLLEMFTGKRPTSDMFKGGLTLHSYVKESMPEKLTKIIDHGLVEDIDQEKISGNVMLGLLYLESEFHAQLRTREKGWL